MNRFECRNCGFLMEQEERPENCPVCGESDFERKDGGQTAQPGTDGAAAETAPEASRTRIPAPAPAQNVNYRQFREFPAVQRERMKLELEETINSLREETAAYQAAQQQKSRKRNGRLNGITGAVVGIILAVGFLGTGCVSCMTCFDGGNFGGNGFPNAVGTLIAGLLLTVAVGVAAYLIIWLCSLPGAKKYRRHSEGKEQSLEESKRQCQAVFRETTQSYAASFEQAVKAVVQRFVSNKTTEEIGDRIAAGFLDTIERAPRGDDQKDVLASCSFTVYADQIQYGSGVFHFSQNHCANLSSPVEQAALAQAIAAHIEIRVMEKYGKDPCGSVPRITISSSDAALSRTVTVQYAAANTNYRGR